jgi:hypothetical protein
MTNRLRDKPPIIPVWVQLIIMEPLACGELFP